MIKECSIYKIENTINGKVYIGQSIDPKQRWTKHKWLAENKQEQYIHKAMAKYGIENFTFEVILICDKLEVDLAEDELIKKYNSRDKEFGYNIKPGGYLRGEWYHSDETINKLKNNWATDHPLESIKKAHESRKGYVCSEETKQKIAIANKGKQFCLGHKQSQETIDKRVASIAASYGEKKCSVDGCERGDDYDGYKIGGIRYCKLHARRLDERGSTDLLPRPPPPNKGVPMSNEVKEKLSKLLKGRDPVNKIEFTDKQIKDILSDTRSANLIGKEYSVSKQVILRIRKENKTCNAPECYNETGKDNIGKFIFKNYKYCDAHSFRNDNGEIELLFDSSILLPRPPSYKFSNEEIKLILSDVGTLEELADLFGVKKCTISKTRRENKS